MYLFNPALEVNDNKKELITTIKFREFAYLFNFNIKKTLISWADRTLDISKKIYGENNMEAYLNFHHARYCKNLTLLERIYLERIGTFGIGKAIKH